MEAMVTRPGQPAAAERPEESGWMLTSIPGIGMVDDSRGTGAACRGF